MGKRCCFILERSFLWPLRQEDFDERLLALLYHLTFSEGVSDYYFPYDEEAEFSANRILGSIRVYAPELRRILLYPEGGENYISYRYMGENRFEERQGVDPGAFMGREGLCRALIDECDVAIFCLTEIGDTMERRLLFYAEEKGKRTVDLAETEHLPKWFQGGAFR